MLLGGGDKTGLWNRWCQTAIPDAERAYQDYLIARSTDTNSESTRQVNTIER